MGLKDQLIEQYEQGWDDTYGSVCAGCVNDDALKKILRESEAENMHCDFCGSVPAAPLDTLLESFVNGLPNEYDRAIDHLWWDSREGGFHGAPTWDTYDLVHYEFGDVFTSEELLDAFCSAVHEIDWVEKDFITRRRDDVLTEAWDRFCEAVKYKTRFVIWLLKPEEDDLYPGEIFPAKILEHITWLFEPLKLVRVLPAGHRVWRARPHSEPIEHTAYDLGTVPEEKASRTNRMSPAGIPMFYRADDPDTAIGEVTFSPEGTHVTWCQFELTEDLRVVDLTRLPAEPGMFDPELGWLRREIRFLHMFVKQLIAPVETDREDIEYVPTQIVTEYLLHVLDGGERVRGLIYQSSIAQGACVALDIRNDHCIDPETAAESDSPHLRLVADNIRSAARRRCGTSRQESSHHVETLDSIKSI